MNKERKEEKKKKEKRKKKKGKKYSNATGNSNGLLLLCSNSSAMPSVVIWASNVCIISSGDACHGSPLCKSYQIAKNDKQYYRSIVEGHAK